MIIRSVKTKGEALARYAGFRSSSKKGTFVVLGPGRDGQGNVIGNGNGAREDPGNRGKEWGGDRKRARSVERGTERGEAKKGITGTVLEKGVRIAGF